MAKSNVSPSALVPAEFMEIPYNGARFPGCGTRDLSEGANCQLFAYELLGRNGLTVPDLRSSELWSDRAFTDPVAELEPLDLLLFNSTPDPFGAHVAVYLGDGLALHLAKEEGVPQVWPLKAFEDAARYQCFIGAKRVRRLAQSQ